MNVINATVLRNNLSDAVREVEKKRDYLLVARRGKIGTALVDIDFFEDLLAATNKKYLKSIKKARLEYEKGDTRTHQEVFGELE